MSQANERGRLDFEIFFILAFCFCFHSKRLRADTEFEKKLLAWVFCFFVEGSNVCTPYIYYLYMHTCGGPTSIRKYLPRVSPLSAKDAKRMWPCSPMSLGFVAVQGGFHGSGNGSGHENGEAGCKKSTFARSAFRNGLDYRSYEVHLRGPLDPLSRNIAHKKDQMIQRRFAIEYSTTKYA